MKYDAEYHARVSSGFLTGSVSGARCCVMCGIRELDVLEGDKRYIRGDCIAPRCPDKFGARPIAFM